MNIPTNLQCGYCIRNRTSGGECRETFKRDACLAFKRNPLGAIRTNKGELRFPVNYNIPPIGIWDENRELLGRFDTKVRITKIIKVKFEDGELVLHCEFDYYMDDFNEEIKEEMEAVKNRKNLVLIKPIKE